MGRKIFLRKMIKIDKDKNQINISLNNHLYNDSIINRAMKDFESVCEFKKDNDHIIIIPKKQKDIELIGYEFCNYMLGLINNQGNL